MQCAKGCYQSVPGGWWEPKGLPILQAPRVGEGEGSQGVNEGTTGRGCGLWGVG